MHFVLFLGLPLMAGGLGYLAWDERQTGDGGKSVDLSAADEVQEVLRVTYSERHFEVLENYCYDCHMDGMEEGGVNLDAYPSMAEVQADPELWARLRKQLEMGLMPPPDEEQPKAEERAQLVSWIDDAVFPVNPLVPDPGPGPYRRLNRSEYANTIRDLLGVEIAVADFLPPDDSSGGFDNAASAVTLTDSHLRAYLAAAEQALGEAIVVGPMPWPHRLSRADAWSGGGKREGESWLLFTNGKVSWEMDGLEPGRYLFEALLGASQAGDELAKARLRVGEQFSEAVEIKSGRFSGQMVRMEIKVDAPRIIGEVEFLNDFYNKDEKPGRRDRNLFILGMRLVGPLDQAPPKKPETHLRIFNVADPEAPQKDQALAIFQAFAQRAFRREVELSEMEGYLTFIEQTEALPHGFEEGIKRGLTAILLSPEFLIRGEPTGGSLAYGRSWISEKSLAERMSYFLWSSMPDEVLMKRVQEGELRGDLAGELRRMIHDPKFEAFTADFAGQWLGLRDLEQLRFDRKAYPEANDLLLADLRQESELLFEEVFRKNLPVTEFVRADYAFLNSRLASHYGLEWKGGDDQANDEFRKVKLPSRRRGVLTQGAILALNSEPTRTSPVLRGKWVLESLLGQAPPPPPGDIPPLSASAKSDKKMSHREQLELHRSRPDCAACHRLMDPIGLALENYDATGAWRTEDHGLTIDAATTLPSGQELAGPEDLLGWLAENREEVFVKNLASKLLSFALGRQIEYYDQPAIDEIYRRAAADGFKSHTLLLAVIESIPMQMKRRPAPSPQLSQSP